MAESQELHAVHGNDMMKSMHTTETEVPSEAERDAQALARLGKKPILAVFTMHEINRLRGCESDKEQRRFSFISMMGFTCTILITWEAELM